MMSKRKPSILYSRALSTRVSIISFSIILCSAAVSGQQEPFSRFPFASRRMIVIWHDLVEIGVRTFAALFGVGVVEDHILYYAQAGLVQPFHHYPVFPHAGVGIDRVATLRNVM